MPILRVTANPFHVLCLSVDATADDVEQRAEEVLRDIDAGTPGADTYVTPLGRSTRTRALVLWACKQLRDPDKRLHHEVWFLEPVDRPPQARRAVGTLPRPGPRPEAWRAFGWRAR